MTAADILTKMSVLDNELDINSGGADETRALAAADMAQDAFEALVACEPDMLGETEDTLATVASTPSTVWPAALLRVDNLYLLDTTVVPYRQRWKIENIQDVGGQAPQYDWPISLGMSAGTGAPRAFYTNRAYFWWAPVPDQAYTFRTYGLRSKTNLTTRLITFGYPDLVSNPLAAIAVRLMEMGIDDPSEELERLAAQWYKPVLRALANPVRQRPQSRVYDRVHTT